MAGLFKWRRHSGLELRDSKELFFIGRDQKMMGVDVTTGARFEASVLQERSSDTRLPIFSGFDVGVDGRFPVPMQVQSAGNASLTVVVNWQAGLKK